MTTRTRVQRQTGRNALPSIKREPRGLRRRRPPRYLTIMAFTTFAIAAVDAAPPKGQTGNIPALVPVGDAGNAGELSGAGAGGAGPDRICGGVSYPFELQKFEVTAAEYAGFLNAVAADDLYGLYDPEMASHSYGCRIERAGTPGRYAYSVDSDWAHRPVNFVSWGDAARYANWLTNGQPVGEQGAATTENGSYILNGALSDAELLAVTRRPDATYVVPTEDEWYKAAYYKSRSQRDAFWDYPTRSHVEPGNDLLDPDPGNNANFYQFGYTLGPPYYRSEAGAFANSSSAYGTYDQGGNVKEWTETILDPSTRCVRGGSCFYGSADLHANKRFGIPPTTADNDLGFRVALVPEPATALMLLAAVATVTRRPRNTSRPM